jgi:hypothetical protein
MQLSLLPAKSRSPLAAYQATHGLCINHSNFFWVRSCLYVKSDPVHFVQKHFPSFRNHSNLVPIFRFRVNSSKLIEFPPDGNNFMIAKGERMLVPWTPSPSPAAACGLPSAKMSHKRHEWLASEKCRFVPKRFFFTEGTFRDSITSMGTKWIALLS